MATRKRKPKPYSRGLGDPEMEFLLRRRAQQMSEAGVAAYAKADAERRAELVAQNAKLEAAVTNVLGWLEKYAPDHPETKRMRKSVDWLKQLESFKGRIR
jgi:hypothetical protein